jgi:hypothetical protein
MPPAATSEKEEDFKWGPLHTVPQTAFPTPRQEQPLDPAEADLYDLGLLFVSRIWKRKCVRRRLTGCSVVKRGNLRRNARMRTAERRRPDIMRLRLRARVVCQMPALLGGGR